MGCTARGIACLTHDQWRAFAEGRVDHVTSEVFGESDGLSSNDVLPLNQVTATASRDGRVWFSTAKGFSVVTPHLSEPMPMPVLDYVQVDAQRTSIEPFAVSPGAHRITFAYTAPSTVAPEQIRFRYKLIGWDRSWIEAGTERVVSYTGLPPGRYVFQVIALNRAGRSNGTAATIVFHVEASFWQNGWFRLMVALGLIGLAVEVTRKSVGVRAERVNLRFQERASERELIAHQIHDTVIQDMVGVAMQLELLGFQLTEKPERATQSLDALASTVRGSIARNRNMVSNLHLTTAAGYSLIEVLRNAEAEFRLAERPEFDLSSVGEPYPIDSLVRDEVYRICREALSNAFRHSSAQCIRVRVDFRKDRLIVTICDDGKGIEEAIQLHGRPGHFGLRGMQAHAKQIGATLGLQSQPAGGTTITLRVQRHKSIWTRWFPRQNKEEENC